MFRNCVSLLAYNFQFFSDRLKVAEDAKIRRRVLNVKHWIMCLAARGYEAWSHPHPFTPPSLSLSIPSSCIVHLFVLTQPLVDGVVLSWMSKSQGGEIEWITSYPNATNSPFISMEYTFIQCLDTVSYSVRHFEWTHFLHLDRHAE